MKNVSRVSIFLLLISFMYVFSACGGESKPSEKLIHEDLNAEITNYKPFLTVKDIVVEQSLTKKGTYSAMLNVTAQSAYAEYEMQADVEYVKYDQGWDVAKCEWTELGYEVKAYPSIEQMTDFINNDDEMVARKLNSQVCTDVSAVENTITCTGTISEGNRYISFDGEVISDWSYDPESDSWILGDIQNNVEYHLQDISGEWKSDFSDTTITISNFTEDTFDISSEVFQTDTICVERVEQSSGFGSIEYIGTGSTFGYYDQYNRIADSQDLHVYIKPTAKGIQLWFMIKQGSLTDIATIE